jgi:hypothetical protein
MSAIPKTDNYQDEIWLSISGFEGIYEISNKGRVKSLFRQFIRSNGCVQTIQERIIRQRNHPNGYLMVSLSNRGIYTHFLVHRIVAKAFIGEEPAGHEVAHNDGIKTNNCVENIRYALPIDNTADNYGHGKIKFGIQNSASKINDEQALNIFNDERKQHLIAKDYGVSQTLISAIKTKKVWVKAVS